jgi:microcystin-dependent protein
MDPIIGEIILFAGNYAPVGWALCNGQALAIQQYQVLFSILGTTYGGDGVRTFNLPDLRGRVAIQAGQGPGLGNHPLGELGGAATITPSGVSVTVGTTASASSLQPQNNMPPYLALNYIIALEGIYPQRP